jgi:aryl-alcohol dehydrogenase-like predicted oxidoreductase
MKNLLLGTAQWGWTLTKSEAFTLLDRFYEAGFRSVDTATNYPINKKNEDFRQAESYLAEWLIANGVKDLELMMKVGSVNNLRTPECNLSPSFLLMSFEYYQRLFTSNLSHFMIHWDNREDEETIGKTVETLRHIQKEGAKMGLSGIKCPHLYAKYIHEINVKPTIQIKHNIFVSDYGKYEQFHQKATFVAYGTNAGGVKLDTKDYHKGSVLAVREGDLGNSDPRIAQLLQRLININKNSHRPPITHFFQVGMLFALLHHDIHAMIIAPSTINQMDNTISFLKNIELFDYQELIK